MRWTTTILAAALVLASGASARHTGGAVVALVTAEQQNQLIAVELPSGKIRRTALLPAGPENVAIGLNKAVVASPRAGAVTLLDQRLKVVMVLRSFAAPHIVVVDPLKALAYVTDDPRGELSVIGLGAKRIVARVSVGAGAHHMALSPCGHRLWIALGEHASAIAIVDLTKPIRPRLLRRFSPGFVVHDLAFSHDCRRVWVTSGVGDAVHVLDAHTGRKAFSVRVGAAPQHVAFTDRGDFAFATSGYSGRLIKIDSRTGRIVASTRTPYGSFNLSTFGKLVVTTSLMSGRVTEFDVDLHRLGTVKAADATRAVALTIWP
jgi:DNA-binding beta-propeller fold protein YncE